MSAPDIDDDVVILATFVVTDIQVALTKITLAIRRIRNTPGWKSSDIQPYREARNALQKYLPKAHRNQLTNLEHVEVQATLNHFAPLCD